MKSADFRLFFFDSPRLRPYDCAPMSYAPLPGQVDVRKLAAKGAEISAQVRVSSLPRVVDMLANAEGSVAVTLRFYIDEDHKRRVDGHLSAQLEVICQRCLEPMPLQLETAFALGIVWSEDEAKQLSSTLDPWIVGEELTDLTDIVSEELILGLPFVNYHDADTCTQKQQLFTGGEAVPDPDTERENPFRVLEQLKREK